MRITCKLQRPQGISQKRFQSGYEALRRRYLLAGPTDLHQSGDEQRSISNRNLTPNER